MLVAVVRVQLTMEITEFCGKNPVNWRLLEPAPERLMILTVSATLDGVAKLDPHPLTIKSLPLLSEMEVIVALMVVAGDTGRVI